jgi:hypothetical protein
VTPAAGEEPAGLDPAAAVAAGVAVAVEPLVRELVAAAPDCRVVTLLTAPPLPEMLPLPELLPPLELLPLLDPVEATLATAAVLESAGSRPVTSTSAMNIQAATNSDTAPATTR